MLHLGQIEREVIGPQTRPPANRRRLRWLQVRKRERRQVTMLPGKVGERIDYRRQPLGDELQGSRG